MKKLFLVLLVFGLLVGNVSGVNIYQEGKGIYFRDLHFSIGNSLNQEYIMKWGGVFTKRLNDRLDVGFMLDYSHYNRREGEAYMLFYNDYYYETYGFQGESISFGPVIGYTKSLGQRGFGLRSLLSLRFTLSNVVMEGEPGKLALAGFGSDFTINFFKEVKLGKSLSVYPGLGLFLSANHTTGRNFDTYLKDHGYGNLTPDFLFQEKGIHTAYGVMAEIPISIKIFKNKHLIVKPSYFLNFKNNGNGLGFATSITFNFCFLP